MATPDCPPLPSVPTAREIVLPGGAALSQVLAAGSQIPGMLDAATNLLAQAAPAMAPLVPFFDLLDAVLALVACVEAVPASLGPPPDPTQMAGALAELADKVAKLLGLVPQLSAPRLVVGVLDTLIDYLQGVRSQLEVLIAQADRIAATAARAAELGDAALAHIASCAGEQSRAQLQAMAAALAPMDRLGATLSLFLGLLGLPEVPALAALLEVENPAEALAPVADAVTLLQALRDAVPVP
jgi:hypothetical protein